MKSRIILPLACALVTARLCASAAGAETIQLDSLPLIQMTSGAGSPQVARSIDGNPLTLNGKVYQHGVGTHAPSEFRVALHRQAKRFDATVGLDDEKKGEGSIRFEVRVDGKRVVQTPVFHGGDPPQAISVDLTNAKAMTLIATDAGDGINCDHADWADARFELVENATARPEPQPLPLEPLTKLAYGDGPAPAIHGPRVTGSTPGRPFLFLIPATGKAPLTFSATGLPQGLTLNSKTGIIKGSLVKAGTTKVEIAVKGPGGVAHQTLTIVGGKHKIAQTPPMGWNSWNVWAVKIDDAKVRAAADAMVSSGLAAHGFQYINIDDCWEAGRDAEGNILSNAKFPDMKALADYVHSKGLKIGIYSSPGPTTCGGYTASYQHEQQDANTYAKWGIDYLKYDWCSYGSIAPNPTLTEMQKPYAVMGAALENSGRDILFSLCQYGGGDVWKWGAAVGGTCWRTTGDINDSWGSLNAIAFTQNGHEKYAGPGHWNDPDMLIVGKVGWGYGLRDSRLNPNEQVLHMSMWSLLSSPLLIGCDISQLDRFTLSLLTNDEVLDVNQDPMGVPAGRKAVNGDAEVWARPLSDGTTAVGLFNRGPDKMRVTAFWKDLGLKGAQPVRNLWLRKNVGVAKGSYAATVAAHGCVLVKIGKAK